MNSSLKANRMISISGSDLIVGEKNGDLWISDRADDTDSSPIVKLSDAHITRRIGKQIDSDKLTVTGIMASYSIKEVIL